MASGQQDHTSKQSTYSNTSMNTWGRTLLTMNMCPQTDTTPTLQSHAHTHPHQNPTDHEPNQPHKTQPTMNHTKTQPTMNPTDHEPHPTTPTHVNGPKSSMTSAGRRSACLESTMRSNCATSALLSHCWFCVVGVRHCLLLTHEVWAWSNV